MKTGCAGRRDRDLIEKRKEYAEKGIAEYWVVDPIKRAVRVLRLKGADYVESGTFTNQQTVRSTVLSGFAMSIAQTFSKI